MNNIIFIRELKHNLQNTDELFLKKLISFLIQFFIF